MFSEIKNFLRILIRLFFLVIRIESLKLYSFNNTRNWRFEMISNPNKLKSISSTFGYCIPMERRIPIEVLSLQNALLYYSFILLFLYIFLFYFSSIFLSFSLTVFLFYYRFLFFYFFLFYYLLFAVWIWAKWRNKIFFEIFFSRLWDCKNDSCQHRSFYTLQLLNNVM